MSRAVIAVPETENGVAQYISQNCKGYVAKTMAKQLAARYGKDAIRICAHDTDRVRRDFPKLNEKKAELLAASCRAVLILDDLESLLGDANISRDVLDKIVDAYGDRTVEMAKNNAFQFVDVAGFAVSDKIALAAGMARNDARRIRAGVMESVRGVCKKTGCLCAETGAVLSTAYELLGNDVPAVAVQHGCETLCDSYALVKQGRWLYIKEDFVTERSFPRLFCLHRACSLPKLRSAQPQDNPLFPYRKRALPPLWTLPCRESRPELPLPASAFRQ